MKIVLFGEDIFTAAVLESLSNDGHEIAAVICPVYKCDLQYGSIKKAAEKKGIPFSHVKDVNSDEVRDLLLSLVPDIIVCAHLRKILRKSIFSIPAKGSINIHPSLLPKYRGLSPQHQALLHGDEKTGVTIHFIDEGVDTGAIIVREKIPLSLEMDIYGLQMEMLTVYKRLISAALNLIGTNDFKPVEQDTIVSLPYYGPLKDSDRKINLEKTTFENYNLIRAVSKPYQGARYEDITVWSSFIADPATEKELIKEYPDKGIFYKDDTRLVISLRDGFLLSEDFEIT